MNKADLTKALAERADIPKVHAARYINILTKTISEALVEGEKVTISDFGTFTVSKRRPFQGHNPKNKQVIQVPENDWKCWPTFSEVAVFAHPFDEIIVHGN